MWWCHLCRCACIVPSHALQPPSIHRPRTRFAGGMGSNGLTSARHDVFGKELAQKYPESFDPLVPENLVYSGVCVRRVCWAFIFVMGKGGLGVCLCMGAIVVLCLRVCNADKTESSLVSLPNTIIPCTHTHIHAGTKKLTDAVEGSPLDAGKLVLSPTRTYAPIIKRVLDKHRKEIHGMVRALPSLFVYVNMGRGSDLTSCGGTHILIINMSIINEFRCTARGVRRPRCCTSSRTGCT